jgi:hypothetical protein
MQGVAVLALGLWTCGAAEAADRFFFYNQTKATTFAGVYLAPAGSQDWGPNQTLNDKDKTVEAQERLTLTGLARGRFDVKLQSVNGKVCIKRDVDLTKDTTFEFREAELAACK